MRQYRWTSHLLIAGAGILVLAVAGVPVLSYLPLLIVLACPLMMFVMMRGMGCNSHEHGHAPRPAEEPERRPIPPQARR